VALRETIDNSGKSFGDWPAIRHMTIKEKAAKFKAYGGMAEYILETTRMADDLSTRY
jgi:hypothetical protein